jgi:hypothetical protein
MGPIDYTIDVQTPFQAALQGYGAGAQIRNDQQQQELLAQQQAAAQQQRTDLANLVNNPNAGAKDYAAMTLKYPGLKDQFKQAWDTLSTDQRKGQLEFTTRAYSALSSGRPDVAEQLLRDRATAMKQSGAPQKDVEAQEMWANLIKESPEQARHIGGLMLSSVMEPDKFASTFATLGEQGRAEDKAPAEQKKAEAEAAIKGVEAANAPEKTALDNLNVRSQVQDRAGRLALDKDKLQSDVELELYKLKQKQGELPEYVAKGVEAATTDAVAAQQSADRMRSLADQIDAAAADMPSGIKAQQYEILKKGLGLQNEVTRIRSEYSRIVTPAAMAAYKRVASGSTSDKDIETAMIGVPKDTDSPERMASFLRGAAKLQAYDAVLNNAKSEWLGAVRHLGKAPSDIEIDGVKVPAGTTFKNFSDAFLERKVAERTSAETIAKSPYAQFAKPIAAPVATPSSPAANPMQQVLPVTGGM